MVWGHQECWVGDVVMTSWLVIQVRSGLISARPKPGAQAAMWLLGVEHSGQREEPERRPQAGAGQGGWG